MQIRYVVWVGIVVFLVPGPVIAQPDPAAPPDPEMAPVPDPPPVTDPPPMADPPADEIAAAPVPPSTPAVSVGSETGYPRAFAARPLVLPAGAFEGTALLALTNNDLGSSSDSLTSFDLAPRARYSFGTVEVEAGASVFLGRSEPSGLMLTEPDRLTSVFAAARFAITRDQSLGAELTATGLTADYSTYQPMAVFAHRAHLAPGSTVEASVGAGVNYSRYEILMMSASAKSLVVAGQLRAIAQASETIAVEARAGYALWKPLGDASTVLPFPDATTLRQDYGVRVVGSVTSTLDVVAGLDVLLSGNANVKTFSLGIVGRSVP